MKTLSHVIYASRSTAEFHEHDIPELLKQVRVANAKHELTGMLLYINGAFVQVIEGQPQMVDAVMSSILRDKRHTQLTVIAKEPIVERQFEGWTMIHKTLDPMDAGELICEPGYFEAPSWVRQLDLIRAKKLLAAASVKWQMEHRSGKYRALGRTA